MLAKLLINAIAFYVVAYLVPGVTIASWQALLVVAIVWALLSIIVKPILVLLTLPINILTLGLFTFVINAFLILLMASVVRGFSVDGFGTALLAAVILSLISIVLSKL